MTTHDHFGARSTLDTAEGTVTYYRLGRLEEIGAANLQSMPYCTRIILESLLRNMDGNLVTEEDVRLVANWGPQNLRLTSLTRGKRFLVT